MLDALISSKTRVKLLLKFFLNSNTSAYLRSLANEFDESTNAIRVELNRLEQAGMLQYFTDGNRKMYKANTDHPLYEEVHNIVMKTIGIDQLIETVIERLGNVRKVYLVGDFAEGRDSKIIDLVFIGNIDKKYLISLVERTENLINRRIRYLIYTPGEIENDRPKMISGGASVLLWSENEELNHG